MRRRQQRLRSWWRHEQQSIAAASLATYQHHSAPRGQGELHGDDPGDLPLLPPPTLRGYDFLFFWVDFKSKSLFLIVLYVNTSVFERKPSFFPI